MCFCHDVLGKWACFASNGGLLLPFACGTFGQVEQRRVEHKTTHTCVGKMGQDSVQTTYTKVATS